MNERLLELALDADFASHETKAGLIPTRAIITLLKAHEITGLITYSYSLLAWDKNFNPIATREFQEEAEARKVGHKLYRRGFHGSISKIVRKKAESGFMGFHAILGRSWTF